MYNPFTLEGRTVLIIGASSGIGRATAIACSKMGSRVILSARNEEAIQETVAMLEGDGHIGIRADVSSSEEILNLVETLPLCDGLVVSAGRGLTLPMVFATREKIGDIFDVNFYAPVELMRMLLKKKKLAKGSSVVFVSSAGGFNSFNVGNGIYGASKAALNAIMKYYAVELAPKFMRVNTVNPGMTNTKFIHRGTITKEQLKEDQARYLLKRYGEPEDIANGIVYLLSNASSWVTGHSLVIDGGGRTKACGA